MLRLIKSGSGFWVLMFSEFGRQKATFSVQYLKFVIQSSFFSHSGILLIAYSAMAVMVRLGFTPKFEGIEDPSTTYSPG